MSNYTLSRASWAYKFVFGQQKEWRLYGHPEPHNDKISLVLFIGLFTSMLIMRPIAFVFMTFLEIGIFLISFLVDGSYSRGKFPIELEIVKIEPWPQTFGYRFPRGYYWWRVSLVARSTTTAYGKALKSHSIAL